MIPPTTRSVAPWEVNPSGLVNWWEMESFSAEIVFWAGWRLQSIKMDCLLGGLDGETPLIPIASLHVPLEERTRDKAIKSLTLVQVECAKIGLRITAETISDVLKGLNDSDRTTYQWLLDAIGNLQKLMQKEMRGKVFLYITPEKAKFFPTKMNPYPLSEQVFNSFPSATYDTNEAAWSLATSRSTAAVFHLMRILEIGLAAIGKVFGVSLAHTNWAPALDQIESKIRDMHKDPAWKAVADCKEQQEFYAQAASHLGILKDAWRNHTMHVRRKYTEEEAEQIFSNVKSFMQKLAEKLSE
jgi:hypothetical protein